jgi:hypothetical protein
MIQASPGEHLLAPLIDAHGLQTDAIALGEHLDDLGPAVMTSPAFTGLTNFSDCER